VFVEDIDWRESARMNLVTKAWSRGVYWRRVNFHNRWRAWQIHMARRFADVVMLKGRGLVEHFGRGAPNVHLILDAAHSREMVVAETSLRDRTASSQPLRLVYFGRLTRYKGLTHMLQAVAAARRQGAAITFDIFGTGEQESELRSLAAELELRDIVHFNGSRTYGLRFLEELSAFDLLLAAPLSEDTPRSAIDAQARGIPVLAYDTYYYRDLAAEGAGVVCVPWNDVDTLSRRIVELAGRRAELQRLSVAAVRFASHNTQEAWLARRAAWTLAACRARAR
jgi:glycosyltransferase involved in cell wall biosynthesis